MRAGIIWIGNGVHKTGRVSALKWLSPRNRPRAILNDGAGVFFAFMEVEVIRQPIKSKLE